MTPSLRIRDLEVAYDDVVGLTGVSLDLHGGTTLAVIGPNGSGKSTLLKAITGVDRPRSGTIDTAGALPALVMQSTDVDLGVPITVQDTVAMARYPHVGILRRFSREDRDAVTRAMERLDVTDLAGRQLHDLSGGQRQRVLVAQGLAQESPILLLDEPVTGLDVVSQARILDVIDEERAAERIVVVTTHDLAEARRCDLVLLLATAPVALGTPDDVLRSEHLRAAFGGGFVRVEGELVLDDPHHAH